MLPLTIVSLLVFCEDRASIPSCEIVPNGHLEEDDPEDLKVMMVANLLLLGSEAGLYNTYFRRYYLSKFFKVFSIFLSLSLFLSSSLLLSLEERQLLEIV